MNSSYASHTFYAVFFPTSINWDTVSHPEIARWQHPAMWHVALGSWHWIRQVAASCNVAGDSGMTFYGSRSNVRRIGILHLVSILTISPQSTSVASPGGLQWGVVAGVWGQSSQRGPGAEPLVRGSGDEAPLKLKSFEPSKDRGSWQICHPVKYYVNCSNILWGKVFV